MRRFVNSVAVTVMVAMLVGATGCKAGTPNASAVSANGSAVSRSRSAVVVPGREQHVLLNGLLVTISLPTARESAAAKGRFEIHLRAQNSTEATMPIHVVGVRPQLQDARGVPRADAVAGSALGPGVLAVAGSRPGRTEGLRPHDYVTGILITKYNTTGRGYIVTWDFGPGRLAAFRLP